MTMASQLTTMFWPTVKKKWKKCLTVRQVRGISNHRQPTPSTSSLVYSLPLHRFSSESSREVRAQLVRSLKVPDYLIPPAYRKTTPGMDEGKNAYEKIRGIDTKNRRVSSRQSQHLSPHMKMRANNSLNPLRIRRKPSLRQRGSSARRMWRSLSNDNFSNIKGEDGLLDIENMRQLENTLTERMCEYISRLGGVSSPDISDDTDKLGGDEAGSTLTTSLEKLDNYLPYNGPDANDLYATEETYKMIASDFRDLIVGWSDIAESICAAKRLENSFGYDKDVNCDGLLTNLVILVSDYEDAVLRAERYLQSFEALFRNRVNVVFKGKSILEDLKREGQGQAGDTRVLDKISSILGEFFSKSTSPFDQTWKRADGKAVVCGGQITLSNFDNMIKSQKFRDWNATTSLYEHVLLTNHSSYCFGREAKEESTQRSNRLLNRWMSLYCFTKNPNPNNTSVINCDNNSGEELSERKLFHTVIRQNVDLWSVDGVRRAQDWLKRMQYLKKLGRHSCAPDVDTYNLVLLGFCNLCKLFRHKQPKLAIKDTESKKDELVRKKNIVDGVEKVLLELTEVKNGGPSPNIISLNLALNAIAKAGRDFPDTTCQKTNSLVFSTIGEEKYRNIMVGIKSNKFEAGHELMDHAHFMLPHSHRKSSKVDDCAYVEKDQMTQNSTSYMDPNLDTFHWLVDIYSASGNIMYIKQGMILLKKMIQIRIEEDSNYSICENRSRSAAASFAPSTGTYNSVLRALVEKVGDFNEISNCGHDDASGMKTAKELTELLDSMVQNGSSFPTPVTFLFVLQMWQKTQSPEAGDYAEEILSRMEIMGIYQNELKAFSNAYVLALECWLASAKAGRSGAAERALRLLDMMEAQAGREVASLGALADESYEKYVTSEVFDRSMHPFIRMYELMLKICAATHERQDMSRAMAIAFEIYDKMIHDRIKPSPRTFEMMYMCVRNFLDHHPEEERRGLLHKVFEPASKHGITRGELMGRHKQSLRKGYLAQ